MSSTDSHESASLHPQRLAEKPLSVPYYITTPIFYVNAAPHVGHLYTLVLSDIVKRWQQLKGRPVHLCTGTDEHGMKIQQAATLAKTAPREFCNLGAETFKELAKAANISYDTFIRTSDEAHHDAVQFFWHQLQSRGYIYTAKHEGWYSVADETFYPENAIEKILDPATGRTLMVSRETGREVEWTSEINYHFRMSSLTERLLEFYKSNPHWIRPEFRHKEMQSAVEEGLQDLSISRPRERLSWGIPVPGDPQQTIYVWLDALVNYLTATGYPTWPPPGTGIWPANLHVIGKDITKFHCIYWPAFLLALDLPLPQNVLTHAHWTHNYRKMSKTDGNVVEPFHVLERYGRDTMRFYLARDGGISDDTDYSNERIIRRYDSKLKNEFGNLVARICGKVFNIREAREYCQGPTAPPPESTAGIVAELELLRGRYAKLMDKFFFGLAIQSTFDVITKTNQYVQDQKPWELVKRDDKAEAHRVMYHSAEAVRIVSILLQPVMPEKMKEVLDHLDVKEEHRTLEYAKLGADTAYGAGANVAEKGKGVIIFPALEERWG